MAEYNSLKKCGFCGEGIPLGAGRCPYCGSILEVAVTQFDQLDETQAGMIYPGQGVVEEQQTGEPQNDAKSENTSEPQSDAKPENTSEPQGQDYQGGTGWSSNPIPQRTGSQMQQQPYRPIQSSQGPYNQNRYQNQPGGDRTSLSNGLKVFLTILFTAIPGIGQVAGIITAIVFMSSTDQDRKSFGVAILVASLIMFVLSCLGCFIFSIAASQSFPSLY